MRENIRNGVDTIKAHEFPLTWSQHWAWVAQHETPVPSSLLIRVVVPVPRKGISVADVESAVRWLAERHEVLRARFRVNSEGRPVHLIDESFDPVVRVIDSRTPLQPHETDGALSEIRYPFDLEKEHPVRMAIFTVNGVPETLYLVIHHIACDRGAGVIIRSELTRYLESVASGAEPDLPHPRWGVRQQSRYEMSARGKEVNQRALQHWRRFHEKQPYDLPPIRFGQGSGSGCSVRLSSKELAGLCASLSQRENCLPAALLITAFAASLANANGRDVSLFSPLISNRHLPNSKEGVCNLMQLGRLAVDYGRSPGFRDALRGAMVSTMQAIRHGHYDPSVLCMDRIAAGITAEGVLFNYIMLDKGHTPPDDSTEVQVENYTHSVHAEITVIDYREILDVTLQVGHDSLSTAQARAVIAGIPVLLEQFLRDPAVQRPDFHGVLPRWNAPQGWIDWRGRWLYKPDLQKALQEFPGVQQAAVTTEERDGTAVRLFGCIVGDRAVTPGALREYLLSTRQLPGVSIVPDEFVVRHEAPYNMNSIDSWLNSPGVTLRGSGRIGDGYSDSAEKGPEESAVEKVLLECFRRLHPVAHPHLSLSYAESGGEYTKIPALIGELRDVGYGGISVCDLLSAYTFRRLAEMIREY
ncbi:condensation domain-containing protein [Streptomyces sp. MMG1533]|uniref:condensation domain-containing protein n=1 Tax=Streptomyces sp. MMG1533 TaxID=1415546 RepID=UPI000AE7D0AE|nr:condensation domain-containing protein [Streptomyces sp. MMG1533]